MVADKIEVTTKKAGEDKAYTWISDGSGEYEIVEADKADFGTEIKMYLKDDESEFLDTYRIESVVKNTQIIFHFLFLWIKRILFLQKQMMMVKR